MNIVETVVSCARVYLPRLLNLTIDFAYYVQAIPGCYFFLGTSEPKVEGLAAMNFFGRRKENGSSTGSHGKKEQPNSTPLMRTNCICHSTEYDFNDNVLPRAIVMFCKIVEDRFGVKLFGPGECEAVFA